MQDYHLDDIRDEKAFLFVEFEIILPLLCFCLTPLQTSTTGHGLYDKLLDRFQDLSKVKNPVSKAKV